jgi:hypothetical protein
MRRNPPNCHDQNPPFFRGFLSRLCWLFDLREEKEREKQISEQTTTRKFPQKSKK